MRATSSSCSSCSSFSSPWPDPNSPILAKINFGVPVSDLLLWLDIRDTFLGQNEKEQDIMLALNLAQQCKHPDAVWLTSIFDGKDVSSKEQARKVFLSFEYDARALCFAWWMADDCKDKMLLLLRAADMGYAFACSTLCECGGLFEDEEEALCFAELAASQHERDGFHFLGYGFHFGVGREQDLPCAKENYLIGAELGDGRAAADYGNMLDESDPFRWLWLSRAASHGYPYSFLCSFSNQIALFISGSGTASTVFCIGHTLRRNIDSAKETIFRSSRDFKYLFGPANQAVAFYEHQVQCARLAVDTWTLVSIRLHLIKDLRILIGKMIWEERFEANYKNDFYHIAPKRE